MALAGHPFAKLAGVLKQLVPTVFEAAGGPLGGIAGTVIRKALGVTDDKDLTDAVTAATMTPEGISQLKLAELDLQKLEADNGFKFAELDVRDLESARNHEVEMRKQGDKTTTQLAWLLVGAFVLVSVTVVVGHLFGLSNTESTLLGTIIGYLLTESKQVTAFYFGSSRGSREKDATIAEATKE